MPQPPVILSDDRLHSARDRVQTYLADHLAACQHDEPLPAVRAIAHHCRASKATVQAVLHELRERGVVMSVPRRGVFKAATTPSPHDLTKRVDQVDVIYFGSPIELADHQFHGTVARALHQLAHQRGLKLRRHVLPAEAESHHLAQLLKGLDCKACLTINLRSANLLRELEHRGILYVNLMPACADIPPYSLVIDPQAVVERQLTHLLEHGHRRIAYLSLVEPTRFHRDHVLRRESFYQQMAHRGLAVNPAWVAYGGYETQETMAAFTAIMSSPQQPTAVIAADLHLIGIYLALAGMGIQPGRNFSVVGTDDTLWATSVHPKATSLRVQIDMAIESTLTLLGQRMIDLNTPIEPVKLSVELVSRQSVCAI